MITKSKTIIYVFCPANFATGGPEALHQLAQQLITLGFNVYLHYYHNEGDNPVHPNYEKYNVPYLDQIINHTDHIIITPETYLKPIFEPRYSKINKIIWWLSVTNYEIVLQNLLNEISNKKKYQLKSFFNAKKFPPIPTIHALKKQKVLNLAHSYFSIDFLKKNEFNIIGKISDYMSDSFYQRINSNTVKEDIILYNPIKNGAYLELIKQCCPELNWKPLINMTPDEVAFWMNKSKMYIDFGYHPGQERMPREAILMGCIVITGCRGSAGYQEDVPLPDGYKFDEQQVAPEVVANQIRYALTNYHLEINKFSAYKKTITAEKDKFKSDVETVFNGLCKK